MASRNKSAHAAALSNVEGAVIDLQRKSSGPGGHAPADHPVVWLRGPNGVEHHVLVGSGAWVNLVEACAVEIPEPPAPERVVVEVPAPLPQRVEVYVGSAEHRSVLHQAEVAAAANERAKDGAS